MALNPIKALSEQIQKLINEHGSASILRDHLALFKDQVVILEKKITLLESEGYILKAKNLTLKANNNELATKSENLEKDNEKLRHKIQKYEQPSHNNLLDKGSVNILKLLFAQDNLTSEQIAQSLNIDLQTATFHLKELKTKDMLKQQTIYQDPPPSESWFKRKGVLVWTLRQKGTKYLINNKLNS